MFTGNKGEWSEAYSFLKLLAEGKLDAADANLNAIPNIYYPIIKILRSEKEKNLEYIINGNIIVYDSVRKSEISVLPISEFISKSKSLFVHLKESEGRSFSFPEIEEFLGSIDVHQLSATSVDKSDIKIVVHDLRTGLQPELGFSIKSMLGRNSTLFNPGNTTNFIYEIEGESLLDLDVINLIEEKPKIVNRIAKLKENGFKIHFHDIQSKTLKLNLQLIDSDLPEILAALLLIKYSNTGVSTIVKTLEILKSENPLTFDLSEGHPFYEYKLKNFLTDAALGMTPSKRWDGHYDATGGIIIV